MKYLSALLLVVLALGCDEPASDDGSKADTGGKKPRSAQDASSTKGDEPNGEVKRDGGGSPGESKPNQPAQPTTPSGAKDGGVTPTGTPTETPTATKDGGATPTQTKDGAVAPPSAGDTDGGVVTGSGSCCAEHDTGGCGNADLMVCVCEKDPSCCTKAWGRQCVFIVEQKYCQAGVRDCVCGSAEGQWGQTTCCESQWSSMCDSVAKLKCDAVAGCF